MLVIFCKLKFSFMLSVLLNIDNIVKLMFISDRFSSSDISSSVVLVICDSIIFRLVLMVEVCVIWLFSYELNYIVMSMVMRIYIMFISMVVRFIFCLLLSVK